MRGHFRYEAMRLPFNRTKWGIWDHDERSWIENGFGDQVTYAGGKEAIDRASHMNEDIGDMEEA